jgi:hypothetical protein
MPEQGFASRLVSVQGTPGAVPTRTLLGIAPIFCFELQAAECVSSCCLTDWTNQWEQDCLSMFLALFLEQPITGPEKALSYRFSRDSGVVFIASPQSPSLIYGPSATYLPFSVRSTANNPARQRQIKDQKRNENRYIAARLELFLTRQTISRPKG